MNQAQFLYLIGMLWLIYGALITIIFYVSKTGKKSTEEEITIIARLIEFVWLIGIGHIIYAGYLGFID